MFLTANAATPVLPPRPNLGPEPWPEPAWPSSTIATLAIGLLVLGLLGWGLWRRRRRETPRGEPATRESTPPAPPMIAWSEAIRAALVARFGPSWAAKTTEEILDDPDLVAILSTEHRQRLTRFLHEADRAKFAGETDQGEDWSAWVADFSATIVAAGTTSRIKG
jgi:LPXTG-motif cell wall-anchored protein